MWRTPGLVLEAAAILSFVTVSKAQYSGWSYDDQVNSTLCTWELPRVLTVRDIVYIDGGRMGWVPGLSNGQYGPMVKDDNLFGLIFSLDLKTPFRIDENLTSVLGTKPKLPGGEGLANNIAPNYVDGGLLGNDAQFNLYGGLVQDTMAFTAPEADALLGYEAYKTGGDRPFSPGFVMRRLPSGVTRYVAYGAAVSAPSENKAWYFSGLRSPTHGPIIDQFNPNMTQNAINASDTLISVTFDTQTQSNMSWTNDTLPDSVPGRAGADAVFLPIGANGIIVVVGGVTYPDFASITHRSQDPAVSKSDGEGFMKNIDIYDIASGKWYKQPTASNETVPARAHGCAVAVPAQDRSSFNIYYYGGKEALSETDNHSDDVWILTVPSFTWIKAKTGNVDHARAGHRCVTPYPDQMMVIGGYVPATGRAETIHCLSGNVVQMLNLTSLQWMDNYHPENHHDYGVPDVVQAAIGGGYSGGATLTTPAASGWGDSALGAVFATAYPTERITTWYPYRVAESTDRPEFTPVPSGDGLPKWVAPTLGVVLGLGVTTALIVLWILWRKRRLLRRSQPSEPATDEPGARILSWIRGQPSTKAMTNTSESSPPLDREDSVLGSGIAAASRHEVADTQIAELADTSPRQELQDTGLTPIEVINKHTRFARKSKTRTRKHSSSLSSASAPPTPDQDSSISGPSATPSSRGPLSADSSASAATPPPLTRTRVVTSDVSAITDRDRSQLRDIGEGTVSSPSESDDIPRMSYVSGPVPALDTLSPLVTVSSSPLSTASVPVEGSPARATQSLAPRAESSLPTLRQTSSNVSTARRSLFHENREDLGDV